MLHHGAMFCFVIVRKHKDESLTSFKDCLDAKWDMLEQHGKLAENKQLLI